MQVKKEPKIQEKSKEQLKPPLIKPYKPPIPFPQRLTKQEHVQKFIRFLETFTDLHINIPLVKAIAQMPKYVKFLKELISCKKKL